MIHTERPRAVVDSSPVTERTNLLPTRTESYLTEFPRSKPLKRRSAPIGWLGKVSSWVGTTGIEFRPSWDLRSTTSTSTISGISKRGGGGTSYGISQRGYTEEGGGEGDKELGIKGWREWADEELSGDALVLPLLLVTFSCAIADAITLQLYATFATSMTGNTVLLAMRCLGPTDKSPLFAALSLIGFTSSGLIFGQLGGLFGHQRRAWLLFNFGFQVVLLLLNVLLVSPSFSWSQHFLPLEKYGGVYLFILAFQGGIQVTQAANSGARELPTAMMTTPYAALLSDPSLFSNGRENDVRSRNRRFLYILIFWLGAFGGAALVRWSDLSKGTMVVLGCKVVVLFYIACAEGSIRKIKEESDDEALLGGEEGEGNGEEGWSDGGREQGGQGGRAERRSRDEYQWNNRSRSKRRTDSTPPTLDRESLGPKRRASRDERIVAM